jgi:hypothetical protein
MSRTPPFRGASPWAARRSNQRPNGAKNRDLKAHGCCRTHLVWEGDPVGCFKVWTTTRAAIPAEKPCGKCGVGLSLEVSVATIHRRSKGQDPQASATDTFMTLVMSSCLRPRAIEPRSGKAARGACGLCRRKMHTLRTRGTKPMKLEPPGPWIEFRREISGRIELLIKQRGDW